LAYQFWRFGLLSLSRRPWHLVLFIVSCVPVFWSSHWYGNFWAILPIFVALAVVLRQRSIESFSVTIQRKTTRISGVEGTSGTPTLYAETDIGQAQVGREVYEQIDEGSRFNVTGIRRPMNRLSIHSVNRKEADGGADPLFDHAY
jgi:hypothetical protein